MKKEVEYINNYIDEKINDEELKIDFLVCGVVKFTFETCQDKEVQMRVSTFLTSAYFAAKNFIKKLCSYEDDVKKQQARLDLLDKTIEYVAAFLEGQKDIDKVNIFVHLLQDEVNRKDISFEIKEAFGQDCNTFMEKITQHFKGLENGIGRQD